MDLAHADAAAPSRTAVTRLLVGGAAFVAALVGGYVTVVVFDLVFGVAGIVVGALLALAAGVCARERLWFGRPLLVGTILGVVPITVFAFWLSTGSGAGA